MTLGGTGPAGDPAAGRRDHYSYTVYAQPETAGTFDQRRFGGPIGSILAETQERVLLDFLGDVRGRSIVDVGTGTGRAALILARRGGRVTGVDASAEMLAVARRRAAAERLDVTFDLGDAHALGLADRSVDAAVSLRVLMHTPDWRRCVGELCRVARERVVLDYPAMMSVAVIQACTRRIARAGGRQVEAYRVLRARAVRRELAVHGYRITRVHRQFVLPIALHKTLGSRRLTSGVEGVLRHAGLLRLFGSPVTVLAERCAS